MYAEQLELDFSVAIQEAIADPCCADLRYLWDSFEPTLETLPCQEQLQLAGEAIHALAEVCQRRAELMLDEWQDQNNTEGPIPDEDFLAGMVQQTMFLDVSGLVRQPKSRKVRERSQYDTAESVAGEVDKKSVLAFVEQQELESEKATILAVAEEENVGAWIEAIAQWLGECQGAVPLMELQRGLGMPLVVVWLGVLLGGFRVTQQGGFYEAQGVRLLGTRE